ncbi:hypothetical protein [Cyanobacterium aponinum]|uniref:hypothetical protein n=1 Tax=Cyanobacterium aponinum TaxID=379064 RepID=UPI0013FD607E|nr:hypothetical protein [Cyanobacterium aponinum]
MTTHFISTEIALPANSLILKQEIEQTLNRQGKPLRWAITSVNEIEKKVKVEAIITR